MHSATVHLVPSPRHTHEKLIGALVRAGLVVETEDAFEKDGKLILFKRIRLTPDGRQANGATGARIEVEVRAVPSARSAVAADSLLERMSKPAKRSVSRSKGSQKIEVDTEAAREAAPAELVETLRNWRINEARRQRVPAYCVMHDRTLLTVAATAPQSESELLSIKGIGPTLIRKYGESLLALLRTAVAAADPADDAPKP